MTGRRSAISVEHRELEDDRVAEIAVEEAARGRQELHGDRLVEAELGVDARDVRIGRAVAEHRAGGIARQQPHEDEDDHHDEEEGRDDLQQPTDDEA